MPRTTVVFFQDDDGTAPVALWLAELRRVEPRAFAKCVVRLERLRELGHELRRPEADTLRDGIHELRARPGTSTIVSSTRSTAAWWPCCSTRW